ncbi:MAG: hypothetical protein QNJ70_06175 [Xenococcaceae cyanobacterium MO_207.B15]|nr:hypothetical protein [Xenococcaceae cyanobacterium MO_207.B15]
MLTFNQIYRYLSVSSTIVLLGLNVAILAQIKKMSSSQESAIQTEQTLEAENSDRPLTSQIWQAGNNLHLDRRDFQLDL